MKQVVQDGRTGQLRVEEIPPPQLRPGGILVATELSVVSAGTDRMVIELARRGLVGKARARPDLVRRVWEKAQRDGVAATVQVVRRRLDRVAPLGYSLVGHVLAVGPDGGPFQVGQRVACAGAGFANHAETNFVPKNLAVSVPSNLESEPAAYVALGAIALHAVHNAELGLGETAVVVGLGLIGQLVVALLDVSGCEAVGVDPLPGRCRLAMRLGARTAVSASRDADQAVESLTAAHGADAVFLTAGGTSHEPVHLAGRIARRRARVVVVGTSRLELPRELFYEKELTLRVSRSYGPGRYDPDYEERGRDYPVEFVRWTENRNMRAFLALAARGKVCPQLLTTHRFDIEQADDAYRTLLTSPAETLGVVLRYSRTDDGRSAPRIDLLGSQPCIKLHTGCGRPVRVADQEQSNGGGEPKRGNLQGAVCSPLSVDASTVSDHDARPSRPGALGLRSWLRAWRSSRPSSTQALRPVGISFVGAGNFAQGVLLPLLSRIRGVRLRGIVSASGLQAQAAGRRYGFRFCTARVEDLWCDDETEAVVIATRHDLHASLALAALRAGKAVWVEKPLAISREELSEWEVAMGSGDARVMVGFNRRFAPLASELAAYFGGQRPLMVDYRMNAGPRPAGGWEDDPRQGGGRLLGEACHCLDFFSFITGSSPVQVEARGWPDPDGRPTEDVQATVSYIDGSLCHLLYTGQGSRMVGKERIEVFGGGRAGMLEDWRRLSLAGGKRSVSRRRFVQNKGHKAALSAFVDAVRTGEAMPIAPRALIESCAATLSILESLRVGRSVFVADVLAAPGSRAASDAPAAETAVAKA